MELPPTTNRSFCRFGASITTTRRSGTPSRTSRGMDWIRTRMSIGQDAFSLCAVRRVWLPRVLCCKDWSSCCGQKKVDRCRHCRRLACGLLPCRVEGRRQDRRPNLRGRPGQCDGCPRRSRGRQTGLVVARNEQPGDRTVPERDVVHAARLGRRTEGAAQRASRERRTRRPRRLRPGPPSARPSVGSIGGGRLARC